MKRILVGVVFFLIGRIAAVAQHYPDKPSVHGMLLMGRETIYASHLPMFHSPHDYQILLVLKFDDQGMAKYQEDRKTHPEELVYTIEPEVFVLPQMVNHTRKFTASIYRGHFERGGIVIAKNISVVIDQVIYMVQFKKDELKPTHLEYILFGNEKEQFIAHVIKASPDFDEIVSVQIKGEFAALLDKAQYLVVKFAEQNKRKGLSLKMSKAQTLTGNEIEFIKHQRLYIEFEDLK